MRWDVLNIIIDKTNVSAAHLYLLPDWLISKIHEQRLNTQRYD